MAMIIKEKVSLAPYTTFRIGGPARFCGSVTTEDELVEACAFAREKGLLIFILGGGSNVLINDRGYDGLVIKMEIEGITEVTSDKAQVESGKKESDGAGVASEGGVVISVGAGVQWDTLVEYAVERGLYGLENLSAIPGTVGAAPVQNIGAYGAEVSDTILLVRAFDTQTSTFVELTNAECNFSYRDSIFKKEKGRYVITRVDFALQKGGSVNIAYKDVKEYFAKKNVSAPSLSKVREAIIDIRWGKLPDWKLWGTAGSFFKNPIIGADTFTELAKKYPGLPGYPEPDGRMKVSLGWILDKVCTMKGFCEGNACVYEKQALVLIAKPGATAEEVVKLAQNIMTAVKEKTGIDIEGEVEWVN